MINCNYCKFINITEDEQIGVNKYNNHICFKHNVRLFHRSNIPYVKHNFIYPCEQCGGNNFEKEE